MAAPTPSDTVKDKEYTNWLKVTLALYHMKLGLHTFVTIEIDSLHRSLINKIYGGPRVLLPPCTMCHASQVNRNKYTGTWTFQKQCRSYCDFWLYQLLLLHANPKSDKIYWNNSTVTAWPFQPWECAKVFMPRGQPPSNTGPAKCDAQALLTLLSNCTHFHSKLSPQGLGFTHSISVIRNKIIHDGEMKLSDADRMKFIQEIIQFLEDPLSLKSMADCQLSVNNIHKIENDSLDIFFNLNDEMTALKAAVNEFRLELGLEKENALKTADSLKEECKQLKEKLTTRVDDFEMDLELHGTRMDSIESNVQQQVPRLDAVEENVQYFDTKLKELKTNTDTVLEQQENKHQEMDTTVTHLSACVALDEAKLGIVEDNLQSLDTKLQKLKTNTDTVLQQQEKKYQEMDTTVTHLSACVALHETKLGKVEETLQEQEKKVTDLSSKLGTLEEKMQINMLTQLGNSSGRKRKVEGEGISDYDTSEAPTKRRPESDGLRRLKNQTEDKLDTLRRLEYIQTRQAEEARKLLEGKRSVVIKGNPGEGKTSTALHLTDNEIYIDRRVMLLSPRHWEKVDTDWVDIVILEDIFGKYDLDSGHLQEWMVHLPTIQDHVDAGKLRVIITTRADIMSKAYSKIGSLKLFSEDLSLTLSSEQLNHSEKMNILNRELLRYNKIMKEDEKEKCIMNFRGLIGFPHCCSLFAGDSKLLDRGPEYFKSPEKFFVANISKLDDTRFLSLAFLFCNDKILEEYLSSETMPECSKHILIELASCLHISEKAASFVLLRDAYNSYLELYVVKSMSYNFGLGFEVAKPCICFTHATVCEAVGQVLGDRCLEMVVKHGNSEYLYQRTYAAEDKDTDSQNVFIPVSVYGLLAERMVHDIVEEGHIRSVVKHSAFKQPEFVMKLKVVVHKCNSITDFFMAKPRSIFDYTLSGGDCITFMQYILQSDEDVVRLVYSHFLEFLACAHKNNSSDCWQCEEKQKLLELSLYYHHFQIADELVSMNAIYTHVSLCNAARHGDLNRVQTILETLKRCQVFNPECKEAKDALCRAYIAGKQSLVELLLKESIKLDSWHVVDTVKHGDINILMKVVEHLKVHNNWNPHQQQCRTQLSHFPPEKCSYATEIPFLTALYITYCNEKFDMADYLLKNEVEVSVDIIVYVSSHSSQHVVDQVIQNLKDTGTWDPHCDDASEAFTIAYIIQKYDVCHLLFQEGVSLKMKNLHDVVYNVSLESVKKAIQHLKDTKNWDPKCDDASKALKKAYIIQKYDVCDLLFQEGISLTMKNLPDLVTSVSLESVKKAIQYLKDTENWDPKCDDASKALENAYTYSEHLWTQQINNKTPYKKEMYIYSQQKYGVCDLLVKEGVSIRMNNLPGVVGGLQASLETVKKAIQHLKDTDNWDPKCDDASNAFKNAYSHQKYDVCNLLVQEGVLTMKHIPDLISVSLDDVKIAVKYLKDTDNWDPKCDYASKALETAYSQQKYDVCNLLVQEGVSLTMKHISYVILASLDYVKTAVDHLKDVNNWDPKCDYASKALETAYSQHNYDVCDLLVQEGVSLTMRNLFCMVYKVSLESVKKTVQHLKDTDNWDPKCDNASKTLAHAYRHEKYDLCDLLFQEGVSLRMKYIPYMISASVIYVKTAVQHLKDIDKWDPKCDYASQALVNAYKHQKYDVCDLLIQEGVLLMMKHIPHVIMASLEYVKKAVKHLKDNDNWDPKCDDASKALANVYRHEQYDVCELLVQEGVSLTMKNLSDVVFSVSLESVKKAIQHLKDNNNWDPKCDDAFKALENVYRIQKNDVCELLVKEGVSRAKRNP